MAQVSCPNHGPNGSCTKCLPRVVRTTRRLAVERLTAIGKRGQARRRELGLTVGALAERLGCTRERVYNLECYGAGMIGTVERWAAALEMDPRELAFGAPRPTATVSQAITRAPAPVRRAAR